MTFVSSWAHEEGVFLTPRGKYIARVLSRGSDCSDGTSRHYTTISQHDTEEEAEKARVNYYKK